MSTISAYLKPNRATQDRSLTMRARIDELLSSPSPRRVGAERHYYLLGDAALLWRASTMHSILRHRIAFDPPVSS